MAKVVSDDVLTRGKASYDWDAWLNGQTWQIEQDELDDVPLSSLRTMAYHAARKRGVMVTVRIVATSLFLKATGPRKDKVTA